MDTLGICQKNRFWDRLWLDISVAAKNDALEDTVDYRSIIYLVQHLVKTLVIAIADNILASSDLLTPVQVTLSKPAAPIPDFGGKISIETIRTKLNT